MLVVPACMVVLLQVASYGPLCSNPLRKPSPISPGFGVTGVPGGSGAGLNGH
jgi:hypothetical protein